MRTPQSEFQIKPRNSIRRVHFLEPRVFFAFVSWEELQPLLRSRPFFVAFVACADAVIRCEPTKLRCKVHNSLRHISATLGG